MTIQENICRLTGYAKNCGLITKEDEIYTVNYRKAIIAAFGLRGTLKDEGRLTIRRTATGFDLVNGNDRNAEVIAFR